jgi:hypothetical protein
MTAAFADELRRAEAAELARLGDHDQAVAILTTLDDPDSQDLLARVYAQRGDLAAADAAWRRVLTQHPGHPAALAGTRLIAEITAGKRRKRPLPVLAVGAGAAVAVILAGTVVLFTLPTGTTSAASPPPPPATVTTVVAPSSSTPPPTPQEQPPSTQLPALLSSLRGPGAVVSQQDKGISVVFDDGLFAPNGSQLTTAGRRQLAEWGKLLSGKDVRVDVVGHGIAVNGGPRSGGSSVALARASAAAQALAQASGLPMTAFTVASADQSAAPHPGDEVKNRTVSLLVTPR